MAKFSIGGVNLGMEPQPATGRTSPDARFHILVMGDFSGRSTRVKDNERSDLASRRPLSVDCDNFDQVMAKLGVQCETNDGGDSQPPISHTFGSLEDFHPDHLYETSPLLERPRHLRAQLLDPATFDEAAREVRTWMRDPDGGAGEPESTATEDPKETPPTSDVSDGDLLGQILGGTEYIPTERKQPAVTRHLDAWISELVKPHLISKPSPDQADLLACVDAVATHQLRHLMHSAAFQDAEAAWRGLSFLISRLTGVESLRISILDISKSELSEDLGSPGAIEDCGVYRCLVERSAEVAGPDAWTAIVANYTIGANVEDLLLAGCLATLSAQCGAPCIAGGSPELVGCRAIAETPYPNDWEALAPEVQSAWEILRGLPAAPYLGLALPRILLRLPYGRATSPVECFDFEEVPPPYEHSEYLWGNAAFACGCLLGHAFDRGGWQMRLDTMHELEGLPLHVCRHDDESELKPCSETLFTSRAIERLQTAGLTPLVTVKGTGVIRIPGIGSIAATNAPLAGGWLG